MERTVRIVGRTRSRTKEKEVRFHRVAEETGVHADTFSVQTSVLPQVRQEQVEGPSSPPVRPVQTPQLAGQSADLLEHTGVDDRVTHALTLAPR